MSIEWLYTRRLKDAYATHVLGHAKHAPTTLSIIFFKKNIKNKKIPPMTQKIKQNIHMKVQKLPQNAKLMFCLFQD